MGVREAVRILAEESKLGERDRQRVLEELESESQDLQELSYRELQDLAQEHGIKANQKREVLIEELSQVL